MGIKLLWVGLTLIVAITAALKVFGINVQEGIIEVVGAVLMLIGLYFLLNDK